MSRSEMEATTSTDNLPGGRHQWSYSWRVRGRVLWHNIREIWIGLRSRPLALLGGIIVAVYLLAD